MFCFKNITNVSPAIKTTMSNKASTKKGLRKFLTKPQPSMKNEKHQKQTKTQTRPKYITTIQKKKRKRKRIIKINCDDYISKLQSSCSMFCWRVRTALLCCIAICILVFRYNPATFLFSWRYAIIVILIIITIIIK